MTRFTLLLLLIAFAAAGQSPELNRYVAEARKALANKDYPLAYEQLIKAHAFHPYHQGILYQLGVMAAATGRPEESVSYLRQALHVNAAYKLDLPELASLKGRADFQSLSTLQLELQTIVSHADTAYLLKDRSLHAESLAVDPKTGTCYVGSVRKKKIVAVDAKGVTRDFVAPGAHGLTSVLGLRIDPAGSSLWACSSPMEELEGYDSTAVSRVSRFDLRTGKLIAQYEPAKKTGHVFGDLVIGPKGQVLVSDSKTNEIYVVNEKTRALDRFFVSTDFWNLQGLAFTDDGRYLFISDYIKGPFRLEISSRKLIKIKSEVENSLKGIDGLLFYKGTLLVLQNGTIPFRVMRLWLNPSLDAVTAAEIVDQGRPELNEPTQGTLIGNDFYYVANSQWGGYDKDHQPKPDGELQDIVVMKFRLK